MNALKLVFRTLNTIPVLLVLVMGVASASFAIGPANVVPVSSAEAESVVGSVVNFSVTPGIDTVGTSTEVALEFILADETLRSESQLEVDFPAGFQIDAIDSITYADSDTLVSDFQIEEWLATGQHLSIHLDSLDQLPDSGVTYSVVIYGVVTPTLAEEYEVVITLLTEDGLILALPAWSQPFQIYSGPLSVFDITPEGIQQAPAGTTLHFEVETTDQYGNEVTVGAVLWALVGVPQVTGTIDQDGNFQAQHTGASRVTAEYQDMADTSSLVYVLPGDFAYFGFTGAPDSVPAGEPWQDGEDDIIVTAYDLFGNVNYEYDGEVYFESTDPSAELPATESEPAAINPVDQGSISLPASGFAFYTAGRQSLFLMQDGVQQAVISPIAVIAGNPANFNLSIPDTVTAGETFNITIGNARDNWGNPVSGQIELSVVSGPLNSPSGASPSLPDIAVSGGTGSGTARLMRAGDIELSLILGSVEKTAEITVMPDQAERFDFALDPVQPIGQPFAGLARLTVLDQYGNVVNSFSAATDGVEITASGSGEVLNGILNSANDFVDGVADLSALGVGYDGNELYVQFTAASQSGITGKSPQVAMSSVKITSARLLQNRRYVGEEFTAEITISNFGNEPVSVEALSLFADNSELSGVTIAPELTADINPLSSQTFNLTTAVPELPGNTLSISLLFEGSVAENRVKDSTAVGELEVLAATGISTVAESLTPSTVNADREYSFHIVLRNENTDALQLSTQSELVFELGSETEYRAVLAAPVTVQGQTEQSLTFSSGLLPLADPGTYPATLELIGTLGTLAYSATIEVFDQVIVETPPQVSYVVRSLSPETIFRGREVDFTLNVGNAGSAMLEVDREASRFQIFAANRQLTAGLLTTQIVGAPAQTNLSFEQLFTPADFPGELDSLVLLIRGQSNGHNESFREKLPLEDITIPGGASVKLAGTAVNAPNAPFVNILQLFSVDVTVINTGAEPLEDIAVLLSSSGSSNFDGLIVIDQLNVENDTTITFVIEAAASSTISELFTASIESAIGSESQLPATIQAPTNPSQTVVVQTPASLNLTSQIDSPPQAQDGRVEPGESFIIAASVINTGQGSVGSGEARLNVIEGDFTVDSPQEQQFNIGEKLQWGITAPADDDTARFEITIIDTPLESNNGLQAKVIDRTDTISVISAVQQVILGVDFEATGPQLLSPGESYDILVLNFDIVGIDQQPYLEYVEFGALNRYGEQISASSVIQSATIDYNAQSLISAAPSGDMLRFPLGSATGIPENATIQVEVADQPAASDFALFLDSASFAARYQSAAGVREVPVIARFANRLFIEQQYTVVEKQLERSFFSYPNPFSPLHQQATIVFSLDEPRPATLTIYTLTGDEVLKVDLPAPATGNEPVTYQWDGRNEAGQVVLNGVYLAILEVQGMGEVRTKIAVMK